MRTKRSFRISAYIQEHVGERVYALAKTRGASVTGIVEAALIEYLAARPEGTLLPLGPNLPRTPGRPSHLEAGARATREERTRKRTGRPTGRKGRTPSANAVALEARADVA